MPNSKKININRLLDLKKMIGLLFVDYANQKFPVEITFSKGIEHPKFKIRIEESNEDFFIDASGTKWIKAKNEPQEACR